MKKITRWLAAVALGMAGLNAQANSIVYYHNDLAGSPLATSETGALLWKEKYRPYGERLNHSPGSAENKVWFTSRRQDVETGLVYMGARYYDPVLGRFVSVDPVGFDEQNVHSHNRYAYAANNPYKFIDPDGRRFEFAYGSSKEFRNDIANIRSYLQSKGADSIFAAIDQRPETVTLQQGAPGVMMYVPDAKTIIVDTRSGNEVQEGQVQSPALGVLHEAAHALQDLQNKRQFDRDRKTFDAQYTNREERRVIEKVESPAARALGEPVRQNHAEKPVTVRCSTCRD